MSQDKPTQLPEWASNPPANTITEPTQAEREEGWQPGNPFRQYMNWLQNRAYQFIAWLNQTTRRTSDIHPDQALPLGSLPSLGAGLSISAADFSGRVYADGYEVPLTDSPAHTYSANSDTYWDLGRDAVWTPVVVPTADPEPAVTSNAVRVFMVTTNLGDRVSVEDRREARIRVDKSMSFDIETFIRQLRIGDQYLTDVSPDTLTPRYQIRSKRDAGEQFGPLAAYDFSDAIGVIVRQYRSLEPSNVGDGLVWTFGARLQSQSAPEWVTDSNVSSAKRIVFSFGNSKRVFFQSSGAVGPSTPFNETAWIDDVQARGYSLPGTAFSPTYPVPSGVTSVPSAGFALLTTIGSSFQASFPIVLPEGSVITGASLTGNVGNEGPSMTLTLLRKLKGSAGAPDNLSSAGGNTFTNTTLPFEHAVSPVDQNNTVDNDTYSYMMVASWPAGLSGRIDSVHIDYNQPARLT
jgi:hypothetical protein